VLVTVLFFVFPFQAIASWDCEYISVQSISCVSCHNGTNYVLTTVSVSNIPEELEYMDMYISYDPEKLEYAVYSFEDCLPDSMYGVMDFPDDGMLYVYFFNSTPIPAGTSGDIVKLTFLNLVPPDISDICIMRDTGEPWHNWCELPTCCHINLEPDTKTVESGEQVQFSAESFYCEETPSYSWSIETEIGSSIDTNGLYTAGQNTDCTHYLKDTITITDTANGTEATATISVKYVPCEIIIKPKDKMVLPGGTVQFTIEQDGCCKSTPKYTWEITEMGSTGSVIDTNGLYTAGSTTGVDTIKVTDTRNGNATDSTTVVIKPCGLQILPVSSILPNEAAQFEVNIIGTCNESCLTWEIMEGAGSIDANGLYTAGDSVGTMIVSVTDNCNDGFTDEETIIVSHCKTTITPSSPSVYTWGSIQLDAVVECEAGNTCNESCYTWEIMEAIDTGSTIDANGLYTAGGTIGLETIKVVDSCNGDIQDITTASIEKSPTTTTTTTTPGPGPSSTTTTSIPECETDADCDDDGLFCSGDEICVNGSCTHSGNPCPDDGLFCNGEESCDEGIDACVSPGNPCSEPTPICDEDLDRCVGMGFACFISIEPETAEVVSGQTLSFTVIPEGDCDDPDYEWSVTKDIGSSIDQNGNYKAGINFDLSNAATDVVTVVDHGNGDITVEATVTVSRGCALLQIYGENSEEVKALRSFRDNVLTQTPEGQEIIKLYYQWNPVIVKAMEKDEAFKEEVKALVDKLLPVIR